MSAFVQSTFLYKPLTFVYGPINSVDIDQVKAAIKVQQDQQIENALLAVGRPYYDLELAEKEIERMVMEASRGEYLNQQQVN